MRLVAAHIEGFGKLQNVDFEFFEGVNKIKERNGWGKTTFASFLFVMFYGFDDKTTKKMRERYAPWGNAPYGGKIIFEVGNKTYLAERHFGTKASEDTFVLRDADSNLKIQDYDEFLGEELFKINAESFLKTVYVGEDGCITGFSDDITAKMGDVSFVDADMRSYTEAQEKLKSFINKNSDTRKTGLLYAKKERLAELQTRARLVKGIKNEIDECDFKIASLKERRDNLTSNIREIEETRMKIAQSKEALPLYEHYNHLKNEVREAERNMRNAKPPTPVLSVVSFVAGMSFVVLGMILFIISKISLPLVIVASAVGFIFLLIGLVASVESDKKKDTISAVKEAEFETKKAELERFVNSVDIKEIERRAKSPDAIKSLEEQERRRNATFSDDDKINRELNQLELRKEKLCEEYTNVESAVLQVQQLEQEIMEGLHQLEIAEKTMELLDKAREGFSGKYIEPLRESFGKYFELITGRSSDFVHIDTNLNITMDEAGLQRNESAFSTGTRDILGLCMRCAMIEIMYRDECPFIIMDDPFVHLDSYAKEAVERAIARVPYQVILFQKI